MGNSPWPQSGHGRLAMRWRWYYFYFVFAIFDLVVIVASLVLYHRTLESYTRALFELTRLDEAQTWVTSLRIAVVQLNAPGNDVFASRRVGEERKRFEAARQRYEALARRGPEFGIDLSHFQSWLDGMLREEERIFGIFEELAAARQAGDDERGEIGQATTHMASMDRYQADAIESLDAVAQSLFQEQHALLASHGAGLERSAAVEKYFLAIVAFILGGMFWYGRKLQQTYDEMMTERQRAMEEKHARLAAVGEVCSAVSHGIRNPLAAINSSAQLVLEYGTLDESTRLRVCDILSESTRLNHRVSRLLNFSNAKGTGFERCDVVDVVRQALNEIGPKLDECRIDVTTSFPERPLMVDGDREWLAQSIIEIVSNSMDNLPGGGTVRVECRAGSEPAGCAIVDLIDNGPGIPESVRPHVFDLFFTSKAEGNGIGLASVKRVVDMHGGSVEVVNGVEPGAHIRLRLPLAR